MKERLKKLYEEGALSHGQLMSAVHKGWLTVADAVDIVGEDAVPVMRTAKLQEVGAACSAAIYAGVDVDGAHYSLTEHDQTELMAQYTMVKEGAAAVPYHADGQLCRMYPAEEFGALAQAATAHVFYHRTYCNHLNAWIRRAGLEELEGITYGADLPEDLAAGMAAILAAAGGGNEAV